MTGRDAPSPAPETRPIQESEPQPALPNDLAALSVLLPRVAAATVALIVSIALIRGANLSDRVGIQCGPLCVRYKPWDKAMFVAAVGFAVLLCLYFLWKPPKRATNAVVSLCAVGGLLVGIARVERAGQRVSFGTPVLPKLIWEGFGVPVAIAALCIAVFFWRGLDRIEASRTARVVLNTGVAAVVVFDLGSLIRTLSNFSEPNNNVYVLNEMLAPVAGKVPGATFVPQYVNLYGWLLVPLRHVLSPRGLAQAAMILLSCFAVLSVVLAVAIALRSMSSPSFWFAAGVIVPLTCVTVLHMAIQWSSIASALQELPIRVFPAMLLSFLGLEELARLRAGSIRTWHLPALGVLAGLIAWNCQDFGVAIAIAYSVLLAVALPSSKYRRSLTLWATGVVGGLAAYPVLTVLAGTPIRVDQIALFERAYGNGFGADLIQVPGPVLIVLPLILSSAGVGWCLLWRHRRDAPKDRSPNDRAILTLALVGTWALGGFAYYLNRSYASGQLQVLLMPCGICAVALASLGRDARSRFARSSPRRRAESVRMSLGLLPAALLAALGLASMLQSPNPVNVVRNIANPAAGYSFSPSVTPMASIYAAETFAQQQGGSLGYFGNNGNYIHLVTGLPNLLLYDDPGMLTTSPTLLVAGCRYLAAHETTWIVVSVTSDSGNGPDVCDTDYSPANVAGFPPRTLFVRNP